MNETSMRRLFCIHRNDDQKHSTRPSFYLQVLQSHRGNDIQVRTD